MYADSDLVSLAHQWFQEQCSRRGLPPLGRPKAGHEGGHEAGDAQRASYLYAEVCPVRWLLPRMLHLIAEHHAQPVSTLRPLVHRMIEEHGFMDIGGDPVVSDDHRESVEAYTDALMKVLERVREAALRSGRWSSAPVSPQMFG